MSDSKESNLGVKSYFYSLLSKYLSVYIRPDDPVVEINPYSSALSTYFNNSRQISAGSDLSLLLKDPPEYLILNENIHYERDILSFLCNLKGYLSTKSRAVFIYYSSLWKPLVKLASYVKIRRRTPEQNWIDHCDIANILTLADFEPVIIERKIIVPFYIPLLSNLINRYLAPLPFFRSLCLVNILIARPVVDKENKSPSVSIVVPARNEAGNIENIVKRIPKMGPDDEIIFIEGNSKDNTWQEILRVKEKFNRALNIKCVQQEGKGKADAVRKGFELATKDVFMILDADLSVSPEALPDFYRAISQDKAEFINGSRLVYSHEGRAMRFCNMVGNKFFAALFSFLVGQRLKDTLCGTKVISRENYKKIKNNRSFFGDFDPFGDFDLILGASRLCLKIREVPVRYYERTYGSTNIKRWKHGLILLRMSLFAARKLKFI